MSDSIERQSLRQIKFVTGGTVASQSILPLEEIPIHRGSRRLMDFGALTYHRHREPGPSVYCNAVMLQSVYKLINTHLADDTTREHGGFLLGYETTMGDAKTPTVVIVDSVAARLTEGSPVRLAFTTETWRDLDEQIAQRYASSLNPPQQVGWYHSHPNIRIFLSAWDLDVCTTYARRKYPVALVVDPINDKGGFFFGGIRGYDPNGPQGFYEAHDLSQESIVHWRNMVTTGGQPTFAPEISPKANESQSLIKRVEEEDASLMPGESEAELQLDDGKPRIAIHDPRIGSRKKRMTVSSGPIYALMAVVIIVLAVMQYLNHREIVALKDELTSLRRPDSTGGQLSVTTSSASNPAPPVTTGSREAEAPVRPLSPPTHTPPQPPGQIISIAVRPKDPNSQGKSPQLHSMQQKLFEAVIHGNPGKKWQQVRWKIVPVGLGTFDATTKKYTAPAKVLVPSSVRLIATSVADPTISGETTIILLADPVQKPVAQKPVTGGPAVKVDVTLAKGGATASNGGTTQISTGTTPASGGAAPTNNSTTSGTGSTTATNVASPVPIDPLVVDPNQAAFFENESKKFEILRRPDGVVSWSLYPPTEAGGGTIDSNGVYKAPDSIKTEHPVDLKVTIGNREAHVRITLKPGPRPVSGDKSETH